MVRGEDHPPTHLPDGSGDLKSYFNMKKIILISSGAVSVLIVVLIIYFYTSPSFEESDSSTPVETKKFALPKPEDIVLDEDSGLKAVKDVIMIGFSSGTDQATMDNIIKSINGEVIGYDKSVNLYQVKIPGANLKDIKSLGTSLISKYRKVEMATPQTVSGGRKIESKTDTEDSMPAHPKAQND